MSRSREPRTRVVVSMLMSCGVQEKLAEAIGGGHDDLIAFEVRANSGEDRAVLLAGHRDARLGHRLDESRGVDLAEFRRDHGQIGVFGIRHQLQGEGRLARSDRHRRTVGGQVGLLGRQRLGDVGEQLADDQYGSGFVDACLDMVAGGDFVVECGELQRAVNGFEPNAGKDRVGRPCVDHSCGPRDGVGKCCGIDFDFHGSYFHVVPACHSNRGGPSWGIRFVKPVMMVAMR